MCIICIEFEKGRLSSKDALKNIIEINLDDEHREFVEKKIKEIQMDEMWRARDDELEIRQKRI